MNNSGTAALQINKFKVSRRGRKLQMSDDQRILLVLPKDIPERIWAEILQKEENDLVIFDIREEIIEEAMRIVYERYMEKQNALFTVHCAAQAWLKLTDWCFFRHDPGEDPSAYPTCYIPKRTESWQPDSLPEVSPKDTWARHELPVLEETPEESLQKWPSSSSLELPVVEDIPSEYWFPGKVNLPDEPFSEESEKVERTISYPGLQSTTTTTTRISDENLGTESEVLQKVTDYSTEDLSPKESSFSGLKRTTPVEGSLHGAGDSTVDRLRPPRRNKSEKSKVFSRPRLDTQYEISSEKVDTPPAEQGKRK